MDDTVILTLYERQILVEGIDIEFQQRLTEQVLGVPRIPAERLIVRLLFRSGLLGVSQDYSWDEMKVLSGLILIFFLLQKLRLFSKIQVRCQLSMTTPMIGLQ